MASKSTKTDLLSLPPELRAEIYGHALRCSGRIRLAAIRRLAADGCTWDIYYEAENIGTACCRARVAEQHIAFSALAALYLTSRQVRNEAEQEFFLHNRFVLVVTERSTTLTNPSRALSQPHIETIRDLEISAMMLLLRAQCITLNLIPFRDSELVLFGRFWWMTRLGASYKLLTVATDSIGLELVRRATGDSDRPYELAGRGWTDDLLQYLLDELYKVGSVRLMFGPMG